MKLLKKLFLVFLLLALCIVPVEATKFGVVSPVSTGIVKYPTWEKLHEYTYTAVDTDTKLLLHFTGKDGAVATNDSATGKAITFVGTAAIDTAYSPFTGGSSLLLDGNSDYVTLADSADWDFGTGDFTIDCRTRFALSPETGATQTVYNQWADANNYCSVHISGGCIYFQYRVGGTWLARYLTADLGFVINQWYHIRVCRNGTSLLIFLDGVSQAVTETTAISTNNLTGIAGLAYIGAEGDAANFFNGNLAEVKIVKGVALSTSDFTPPTSPYIGNTAYEILNLNGDTDQMYMLDCRFVNGSVNTSYFNLLFNNDTGTNYGRQTIYGLDTNIYADRTTTDPGIYFNLAPAASGQLLHCNCVIYAKSGFIRTVLFSSGSGVNGTAIYVGMCSGNVWNNTADNLTSLVLTASQANGLGIGTRISLYRQVYR